MGPLAGELVPDCIPEALRCEGLGSFQRLQKLIEVVNISSRTQHVHCGFALKATAPKSTTTALLHTCCCCV